VIRAEGPGYLRVKRGGKAAYDDGNKNRRGGKGRKRQEEAQQFSRQGEKTEEYGPGYIDRDTGVEKPRAKDGPLPGVFR
jgi:hypothetical protein